MTGLDYVIHSPGWQGSAGVRALHILCRDIEKAGRVSCMADTSGGWHPESPYDLDDVHSWTAKEIENAVHVYPEGIRHSVYQRIARWMLNTPREPYHPPGHLFTWIEELMPGVPRLTVDVVEPEWFYPKKRRGKGTLYWVGDGRPQAHEIPLGAQPIVASSRKEMGAVLRAADLLVSFDWFTAVNLEATICGTPVVVVGSVQREKTSALYGSYGISANEEESRATVGRAAEHYDEVRRKIVGDVDRFLTLCEG